jgi:ABC-type antimicrobial peptide transport system permease subunit
VCSSDLSHAAVAIITESTARRCWPNEDALGKTATLTFRGKRSERQAADFEVVGVVNDVRQADLIHIDPVRVYLPGGLSPNPNIDLMFHIRGNRARALAAVQSAIERMDHTLLPGLKFYSLEDGNIAALRGMYRVMALVAGILALLAITLAVVGIHGVMAFLVSQRTREIGIRVALGATAGMLWKGIVLPGLRPVAVGMAIGFATAVGLDAWYRSTDLLSETLLHRVFGAPAVCAEVALMLAVAALASLVPARRALRVDPMRALRHE